MALHMMHLNAVRAQQGTERVFMLSHATPAGSQGAVAYHAVAVIGRGRQVPLAAGLGLQGLFDSPSIHLEACRPVAIGGILVTGHAALFLRLACDSSLIPAQH